MPNCQNCGHKWSLGETIRVVFKTDGNSGRKCSCCRETQYVTKKSKNRMGLMGITAVLLIAFIRPLLDQDIGAVLLLAIPVIIVMVISFLYITELSNQRNTVR